MRECVEMVVSGDWLPSQSPSLLSRCSVTFVHPCHLMEKKENKAMNELK